MALDVSYLTAAGAGALSFLSPCVLPLVPPYLCYMAGVTVEDFRSDQPAARVSPVRQALLLSSFCFVLGFSTVFVLLGAGASTIGGLLRMWQQEIAIAAGVVIILMGLNFLGVFRLAFLSREARFQTRGKPANPLAAYVMGLAFAFGWTPCIGPVLGPILAQRVWPMPMVPESGWSFSSVSRLTSLPSARRRSRTPSSSVATPAES